MIKRDYLVGLLCSSALLASLLLSPCAWAGSREVVSQALVSMGKEYYLQEDYVAASHAFSKALLLTPFDPEAKYFYDLCSATFYARSRTANAQFSSQEFNVEYSFKAKTTVAPISEEETIALDQPSINQVRAELLTKSKEVKELTALVNKATELFAEKTEAKDQELDSVKEQLKKLAQDLETARDNGKNDQLVTDQKKEQWHQELASKESENADLKQKIADLQKDRKKLSAIDTALMENMKTAFREKGEEIVFLKKELARRSEEAAAQAAVAREKDQQNAVLEAQRVQDKNTIGAIRKEDKKKTLEITALSGQLAMMKKTVAAKFERMQENERQLAALTRSIERTTKAWNKDKGRYEKRIKMLEAAIAKHKKYIARNTRSGNTQLAELEDLLFKNKIQLAQLNNKTIVAEYHLSQGDYQLIERNRKIIDLLDVISKLEEEVLHLQTKLIAQEKGKPLSPGEIDKAAVIKRQDKFISELKARLAAALSTSQKNWEAAHSSVDKASQMEEKLRSVTGQLAKTTAALQKKTEECRLLENEIEAVKQKLDSATNRIFGVGEKIAAFAMDKQEDKILTAEP